MKAETFLKTYALPFQPGCQERKGVAGGSRELGARTKWLRVGTARMRGESFQVSKAAGLFANAQFSFKRAFFPKTTHSEDAEPDNLSMLVYSLHQRIDLVK